MECGFGRAERPAIDVGLKNGRREPFRFYQPDRAEEN